METNMLNQISWKSAVPYYDVRRGDSNIKIYLLQKRSKFKLRVNFALITFFSALRSSNVRPY